jgi:hypothetical protein
MVSLLVKIDPFVGSLFSFGDEVLQFLVKKSRCNEAITTCEGYTFSPFILYHFFSYYTHNRMLCMFFITILFISLHFICYFSTEIPLYYEEYQPLDLT